MSDIDFLAEFAYGLGEDPIDYAVTHVIQSHVEVFLAVRDVNAMLGCTRPLDSAALSRRILGDLMAAGWVPPQIVPEPEVIP